MPFLVSKDSSNSLFGTKVTKAASDWLAERIQEYRPAMLRMARQVVFEPEETEDIVQEASLKALKCLRQLKSRKSVRAWLLKITWNIALKSLVRKARRPVVLFSDYTNGQTIDELPIQRNINAFQAQEVIRVIREEIERLSVEHYWLLNVVMSGDSQREIAQRLGIQHNAVRARVLRIRRRLRLRLEARGIELPRERYRRVGS
ncbi:MAG: RNA polymerase sigma factor [Planctomycetota bacterium]